MALSVASSAAAAATETSKATAAVSANPIRACIPQLPSLLCRRARRAYGRADPQPAGAGAAAADPGRRRMHGPLSAPIPGTAAAARSRRRLAGGRWLMPRSARRHLLFGCPQRARRRPDRGCQLPGIDLLPGTGIIADEVAAAGTTVDLRILEAGWQDTLSAQRPGRHQQAPAGARDHLVGRRQMLAGVLDDRTHAFGDRLILQVDAIDAAVDDVLLLGSAIKSPVVAFIRGQPPATEPVGGVGQQLVAAPGTTDRPAVLEGRLRQRHRRRGALPPQETKHRMLIVERHPSAGVHMAAELAVGRLRPKWEQEIAEAPVSVPGLRLAIAGVLRAPGRLGQMVLRRPIGYGVEQRLVLRQIVGIDVAGVQEPEVRGVDFALERLQVVAIAQHEADADFALRHVENFELRQGRRLALRSHVDPDHAGALQHLIGLGLHLLLEARRRQTGHVEAVAGNIEFPTVIDAAQAALFVAAQKQRGAAVRAAMIHHADATGAVAKGDQLLAKQQQANRRTVAHEFGRKRRRHPITAHQLPHDCARANARQFHTLARRRHGILQHCTQGHAGLPSYVSTASEAAADGRGGCARRCDGPGPTAAALAGPPSPVQTADAGTANSQKAPRRGAQDAGRPRLGPDRRRGMSGMKGGVEALLFDLGRVVIDLDATRILARWTALAGAAAAPLSPPLAAGIAGGEAYRRHERGEISDAAFFAHLRQQLKIELTDAQFVDGWNAIFIGEMPGIRRILANLDGQLPLYAFSNTNTAHYAHWSLRFADLLAPFRKIYVSHQLGARKPEPAAFQAVIADMGIVAPRVLFLDDLAENVAGARACGLMAAQVKSASDVERVLSEIGLSL